MKKIIMTLLAAITMTTAAQAQTQKMVVKQTDGTIAKFALTNIDGISFVEESGPTTVAEAKQMLVGKWVAYEEEDEGFDGEFYEFRSDGTLVWARHVVSDYSYDDELKDYAGKFVVVDRGTYEVIPDPKDPSCGQIRMVGDTIDYDEIIEYANLTSDSFDDTSFEEYGVILKYNRDDSITYVEVDFEFE